MAGRAGHLLGEPKLPSPFSQHTAFAHTSLFCSRLFLQGMPSCWFTSASLGGDGGVATSSGCPAAALPTLLALQATVDARAADNWDAAH